MLCRRKSIVLVKNWNTFRYRWSTTTHCIAIPPRVSTLWTQHHSHSGVPQDYHEYHIFIFRAEIFSTWKSCGHTNRCRVPLWPSSTLVSQNLYVGLWSCERTFFNEFELSSLDCIWHRTTLHKTTKVHYLACM